MNISYLKKEALFLPKRSDNLDIVDYGERNDIPQSLMKLTAFSPTATNCISVFKTFLYGGGFEAEGLNDLVVNSDGETMLDILEYISGDYAMFGGFALQVYGRELYYIPFEYVRICIPDDTMHVNRYAIHNDWTREKISKTAQFTPITPEEIDYLPSFRDRFEPGGDALFYHSSTVSTFYKSQYPLPIYYSAITDISTEGGLVNLGYRNARNNFFPSGMLTMCDTESHNAREQEQRAKEITDILTQFQGDEQAGKLLYVPNNDPNNIPQFIPFQTQNTDNFFVETTAAVKDRIGRVFNQPPVLRAEDVGQNFGSEAITNAYQFYNSYCQWHRKSIGKALETVNSYLRISEEPISILPCEYFTKEAIRKYSESEIMAMQSIISDPAMAPEAKVTMLNLGFAVDFETGSILVRQDANYLETQRIRNENMKNGNDNGSGWTDQAND